MDKFYGPVGYVQTVETEDGEWDTVSTEQDYYGDIIKHGRRLESTENRNDNINVSNEISIISDPYALQHFHHIKYVVWNNIPWKVTNVEVRYPRLLLTLGGVYNGERSQSGTAG